jgi:hypothetical protein
VAGRAGTAVADDLVAGVFLVAWEQRAGFGPTRAGPKAWLYGIATNLLRRHHRSEETRLRAWARDGGRRSTQDEVDHRVAESVDADVRARRMAEALAGLRAEECDVLSLVTAGALSSGLCCRCRSALARRLGDDWVATTAAIKVIRRVVGERSGFSGVRDLPSFPDRARWARNLSAPRSCRREFPGWTTLSRVETLERVDFPRIEGENIASGWSSVMRLPRRRKVVEPGA